MYSRVVISLTLVLWMSVDLPRLAPGTAPRSPQETFLPDDRIPLFPMVFSNAPQDPDKPAPPTGQKNSTLQEGTKLELIRYVSGEFAKARKPLPGGKDGITFPVDKPLNEETLNHAVMLHGAAVNSGDNAQITNLEFHEQTIIVDVNGGGRPKKHCRDHIQIGLGGSSP